MLEVGTLSLGSAFASQIHDRCGFMQSVMIKSGLAVDSR